MVSFQKDRVYVFRATGDSKQRAYDVATPLRTPRASSWSLPSNTEAMLPLVSGLEMGGAYSGGFSIDKRLARR